MIKGIKNVFLDTVIKVIKLKFLKKVYKKIAYFFKNKKENIHFSLCETIRMSNNTSFKQFQNILWGQDSF